MSDCDPCAVCERPFSHPLHDVRQLWPGSHAYVDPVEYAAWVEAGRREAEDEHETR